MDFVPTNSLDLLSARRVKASFALPLALSAKVPLEPARSCSTGWSWTRMDEIRKFTKPSLINSPAASTIGPIRTASPGLAVPCKILPAITKPTPGTCGKNSSIWICRAGWAVSADSSFSLNKGRLDRTLRSSLSSGTIAPVTAEQIKIGLYPWRIRSAANTASFASFTTSVRDPSFFMNCFTSSKAEFSWSSDAISHLVKQMIVGIASAWATTRCSWTMPRISPRLASTVQSK